MTNSDTTNSVFVVMNTQHSLLPDQMEVLSQKFPGGFQFTDVPADGLSRAEMDEMLKSFPLHSTVVFVSPVPYMLTALSFSCGLTAAYNACKGDYSYCPAGDYGPDYCLVFCNDTRVKKELPNGKVISVTAQTGWYLA